VIDLGIQMALDAVGSINARLTPREFKRWKR